MNVMMMMRLDVASTGATTTASYEPIAQIWDIINQHPTPRNGEHHV